MNEEFVFRLPDLGEGLTEAEVVGWRVAVGDPVAVDQVVAEVETAKAVVEVPVPYEGTVAVLHAEAGAVVAVGAPLISVAAVPGRTEQHRTEERAGSGNVLIGYGTGRPPAARRRARRSRTPEAAAGPVAPRVISPLVRKLARRHGLDLATVVPGARDGVIRRSDVERAIGAPAPVADTDTDADVDVVPLRGVRRAIADKLTRSRTEIPDATTWVDADATGLVEAKDALADRGVGLLALLARICVAGLRRFPELNSTVDVAAGEIRRLGYVNLGFAAQTDRGLVVPVVRGAHRMSAAELGAELSRLAGLARAGTLPPGALTGGTFTLNNYGVFGVDGSNAIINHPEAGILGIGRIVDKPWVVDGQLAVRKVTQLSLTFDHRVCDGGAAGGFLRYVADCVERPTTLLADL
ncbi:dihydrolipoamide acetyltransferase family protein [Jidongwangia harbinensis]|uniref:dihydrolipoamide acetyltransferase family protein n=1 Tax=Jidongwangia harbinensis TaxID=2878561 RepID=UPI001CD927DB|nr:dihydrolipoamide acetyltransferase family protein [Jidongwangia harbinensis]MCA2216017.1 2-oxo acid dehydrogenase subunit E2 [Jidongwangia harbinensis]